VGDPRRDFVDIYSEAYYRGRGIDPFIDYVFELENADSTVRVYEWVGILKLVKSLYPQPIDARLRWLDYGCGNGGLVRFIRAKTGCDITGYDEGWIVEKAIEAGIPVTRHKELLTSGEKFDIVTAIEVLEHVEDPIKTLSEIRSLMNPGGLFFFTTGNALPQRKNLLQWGYFLPEIHISLYEPGTLVTALEMTGFRPQLFEKMLAGWVDIIRYKVLKSMGIRRKNAFEKILPWQLINPLVDSLMHVSAHPIAWAEGEANGNS
jgi:SAM-dependent methyltransferase